MDTKQMIKDLDRYFKETPFEEIQAVIDKVNAMYPEDDDSFICEDPDCPHCAYDERFITDHEIEKQAKDTIIDDNLSWEVEYARDAFIAGAKWVRDEYEKQ